MRGHLMLCGLGRLLSMIVRGCFGFDHGGHGCEPILATTLDWFCMSVPFLGVESESRYMC